MQIRLSCLMPVAMTAAMYRLESVSLGLLAGVILFLSVLVHDLAHWVVARAGGAPVTDLMLWPLGGLTDCTERTPYTSRMQALVAGPAVSLLIAAICLFQLTRLGLSPATMNPLNGFSLVQPENTSVVVLQLVCFINLLLVGTNLIPVVPFDAGRILRTLLCEHYAELEARDLVMRLGLVVSIIALMVGFVFDQSSIVALAGFVFILHLYEVGAGDESVPDCDRTLSSSDTDELMDPSCEFSEFDVGEEVGEESDTDELISRAGMMARWSARSEAEQLRREAAKRKHEDEQLDAILERIHRNGSESLKPSELKLLRRVSSQYRNRSKTRHQSDDVKS